VGTKDGFRDTENGEDVGRTVGILLLTGWAVGPAGAVVGTRIDRVGKDLLSGRVPHMGMIKT